MSSLKRYRHALTDETNQGVFDNEEWLISIGKGFAASDLQQVFGVGAVIDYIIYDNQLPVALNFIATNASSELYKLEFFANPTFDDQTGTLVPLVNQNVGSANTALSKILRNPTITDPGTLGTGEIVRGSVEGNGSSRQGLGAGEDINKRILQPGIPLLTRITNLGVAGELDTYVRLGEFPAAVTSENFRQEFLPQVTVQSSEDL